MPDTGKHIEPLGLPGHRLRHNATRQTGQRHTMATQALQIKTVVAEPSEVGCPVHTDVHKATPDKLHRHVFQIRKYISHALGHDLFEPGGCTG